MLAGPSIAAGGEGRLEDTPCADLVRSLAKSTFTGVVVVSDAHCEGRLWWREGQLMEAHWGNLAGYPAMYALLRRKAGPFVLESGELEGSEPFEEDLEDFLGDCQRRADLADDLRAKLPPADVRLRIDLYHPQLLRMGIDVTGLVEVFHRGASVDEALAVSALGELETLQILLILSRAGALEPEPALDAPDAMSVTREESGAKIAAALEPGTRGRPPALGSGSPDVTRGKSRVLSLLATGALAATVLGGIWWAKRAPVQAGADEAGAGDVNVEAEREGAPSSREAALVPTDGEAPEAQAEPEEAQAEPKEAQTESADAEPAQTESADAEPAQAESADAEPAQAESADAGSVAEPDEAAADRASPVDVDASAEQGTETETPGDGAEGTGDPLAAAVEAQGPGGH